MSSFDSGRPPVCVIGLGLIGGSLLAALARTGRVVFGYNRSPATVDAAAAAGYDVYADLAQTLTRAARQSAVIVLATPVTVLDSVIPELAALAPDCLVTDVVSVKEPVAALMQRHHRGARYVGGHPMAGTSESGWAAIDPDLFDGAMWMVATEDSTAASDWAVVTRIALDVGAHVVPAAADAHDRAVAAISHLPHLTANATAAVGAGESDLALSLAAGSFRDGTRVAGTAPTLQRAMLEANSLALLNVLSETIDRLIQARDELRDHGTAQTLVDDGHRARLAYDQLHDAPRAAIADVEVGAAGWQEELRRQGHLGRVWLG